MTTAVEAFAQSLAAYEVGQDPTALVYPVWRDPDVLLGGSDAGAHLDRMLGSAYPTRFLADCLRGRRLVSLEEAVHLLTEVPARLFGLRDRGRLAIGQHADIVVFDPEGIIDEVTRSGLRGRGGAGSRFAHDDDRLAGRQFSRLLMLDLMMSVSGSIYVVRELTIGRVVRRTWALTAVT